MSESIPSIEFSEAWDENGDGVTIKIEELDGDTCTFYKDNELMFSCKTDDIYKILNKILLIRHINK